MRKFVLVAFLLAVSALGFGQSYVTSTGGSITSAGDKTALTVPVSQAIAFDDGVTLTTVTGIVTIQTPLLATGTLAAGGTLTAGGSFIVQIASQNIAFNGRLTSGTWGKVVLANGTKYYVLSGSVTDIATGETGAFVLQTANIGSGNFNVTASIDSISIVLN